MPTDKIQLSLIALSLIIISIIVIQSTHTSRGGITIEFNMDIPLSNTEIFIHLYAVTPNGTSVDLYRGFLENGSLVVDYETEPFRKVIDTWLYYMGDDAGYNTTIIVDAWITVYNRVFWTIRDETIQYNPYMVKTGRVFLKVFRIPSVGLMDYERSVLEDQGLRCYYDWVRDDDMSYSVYAKIPLIILYDRVEEPSRIYVTLSIDDDSGLETVMGVVYGYLSNSFVPNASNPVFSLGGTVFSMRDKRFVAIEELSGYGDGGYIYVNGVAVHEFYKEYNSCYGYTGYEKERVYISWIETDGENIVGGVVNRLPLMYSRLLDGVDLEYYGTLEPGYTGSTWENLMGDTGRCGIGFMIGVGVGALLASNSLEALPRRVLSLMPLLYAGVKRYEGGAFGGGIYNDGLEPVDTYVAVSKTYYTTSQCVFKPAIYYIEFRGKQ